MEGGRNSRLDELQAALLRIKLPLLDTWNARRFAICEKYIEGITHPLVKTPKISAQNFVGHLFVIRIPRRDSLQKHLKDRKILTDIHYPIPDYRQPCWISRYGDVQLTETERACAEVLSLPCFPEMTDSEIDSVITAVNEWSEE
jgi:dTDP-4-amino-4,6-dideoxygalactose transaminase